MKLKPLLTLLPASLTKNLQVIPASIETSFFSATGKGRTYSPSEEISGSCKGGPLPHVLGTAAWAALHTPSPFYIQELGPSKSSTAEFSSQQVGKGGLISDSLEQLFREKGEPPARKTQIILQLCSLIHPQDFLLINRAEAAHPEVIPEHSQRPNLEAVSQLLFFKVTP